MRGRAAVNGVGREARMTIPPRLRAQVDRNQRGANGAGASAERVPRLDLGDNTRRDFELFAWIRSRPIKAPIGPK